MENIRVLIVDDQTMVRRGIVEVLSEQEGIEVVGEASNGAEGIELARATAPDVVVMDLQMPVMNGLEATAVIRAEMETVHIVVFTVSESDADLFAAIRYGARGYIQKNASADELARAVFHAAQGGVILSPVLATKLLAELPAAVQNRPNDGAEQLSAREMEVLNLLSGGVSNQEIAGTLSISENTVKTHMRHILDKLHLANRSQAAAYAARLGLGR